VSEKRLSEASQEELAREMLARLEPQLEAMQRYAADLRYGLKVLWDAQHDIWADEHVAQMNDLLSGLAALENKAS
jgi:hypothetical protein